MSSQITPTTALEASTRLHLAYWWRLGAQHEASLEVTADVRREQWGTGARLLTIVRRGAGRYKPTGYIEFDYKLNVPVVTPLGSDSGSLALAAHFAILAPLFARLDAELVPALAVAAGLIPELSARYGLPYESPRCALFELILEVSSVATLDASLPPDTSPPLITWAALVVDDASSSKPAALAWNYDGSSAGRWSDRADRRTLTLAENLYRSEIRAAMVPRFEAVFYRLFEPASGRVREDI